MYSLHVEFLLSLIDSYKEFMRGKQAVLLDGSILKVQSVNKDVQVFRDDMRLPAVPKTPSLLGFAFPTMDGYAIISSLYRPYP